MCNVLCENGEDPCLPLPQFTPTQNDVKHSLRVGLLIDLLQGQGVLPATSRCYTHIREAFSFSGALPPVRMPQAPRLRLQLSELLSVPQPLVREVARHGLRGIARRWKQWGSTNAWTLREDSLTCKQARLEGRRGLEGRYPKPAPPEREWIARPGKNVIVQLSSPAK